MVNKPKRRRKRDNPYNLIYTINKKYIVSFIDSKGLLREVEINEELYNLFDEFELRDLSELNEYDNHIEHSDIICEETLYKRANYKNESLEDYIMKKFTCEELMKAIKTLPEVQQRRIKKYYFEEKNEYQIALEENASHQAIHKSLVSAKIKLKNILEKFYE